MFFPVTKELNKETEMLKGKNNNATLYWITTNLISIQS